MILLLFLSCINQIGFGQTPSNILDSLLASLRPVGLVSSLGDRPLILFSKPESLSSTLLHTPGVIPFAGEIMAQLVFAGWAETVPLSPDAALADFSTAFKGLTGTVTLKQLIQHKSGLILEKTWVPVSGSNSAQTLAQVAGNFRQTALPGAEFNYRRENTLLLMLLAEVISGKTYARLLHEYLISRLALTETSFPEGALSPERTLTCITDLASALSLLSNKGRFKGSVYLNPLWLEALNPAEKQPVSAGFVIEWKHGNTRFPSRIAALEKEWFWYFNPCSEINLVLYAPEGLPDEETIQKVIETISAGQADSCRVQAAFQLEKLDLRHSSANSGGGQEAQVHFLKIRIRKAGFVSIRLFDSLGNLLETLLEKELSSGNFEIPLDVSNYSSGVYFYEVTQPGKARSHKLNLRK